MSRSSPKHISKDLFSHNWTSPRRMIMFPHLPMGNNVAYEFLRRIYSIRDNISSRSGGTTKVESTLEWLFQWGDFSTVSWGVRQGCPPASLLFALRTQLLMNGMKTTTVNDTFIVIRISPGRKLLLQLPLCWWQHGWEAVLFHPGLIIKGFRSWQQPPASSDQYPKGDSHTDSISAFSFP